MKTTLVAVTALIVIALMTLSAHTERAVDSREGTLAPLVDLTETATGRVITPADMKGKNVILHFWTSTDAQSRINARRYQQLADETDGLELVAVNLDENQPLYRAIATRDSISEAVMYQAADRQQAEKIRQSYDLEDGMRTFLLDQQGVIQEEEPTEERLRTIFHPQPVA